MKTSAKFDNQPYKEREKTEFPITWNLLKKLNIKVTIFNGFENCIAMHYFYSYGNENVYL